MKKREANFTLVFRHWLRANPRPVSAAFELKQTMTDSIAFNSVRPHQLAALQAVIHRELLYKIADDSRGTKPFDMVYLTGVDAFIVIKYPEFFCLIRPNAFLRERDQMKRKSLTSERAKAIAEVLIEW